MVHMPLNPRPHRVHQIHLWPRRRRNLGPFPEVPPVPRTRHPHRRKPNTHNRTARRMANTLPDNPKTCHHPQTDGGTRGGPQGACPHCRLHPARHPCGGPPGHGSTHATDCRFQDSRTTQVPHPQIPAACSHAASCGPGPPPQSLVLPTVRPEPATYHLTWYPPPLARTPCTRHDTDTARTSTTGTAHTAGSMRAPQAPIPPHHRPSTGTANRRPPRALSVCANGYHRRPYPATQTTGSAEEPHTASPLRPLRGPQPRPPHAACSLSPTPTPPATRASSGHSPTPSGTTWEGIMWRT